VAELRIRAFGVLWRVHVTFALMAGFLAANGHPSTRAAAEFAGCALAAALAVEIGHVVALRALGCTPRVMLHYLGGETWCAAGKQVPARKLALAQLTGPLFGLALAFCALLASPMLARVAFAWSLAQLLPLQPMSGGKALAALLTPRFRDRAHTISHALTLALATLLIAANFAWRFSLFAFILLAACVVVSLAALRQARLQRVDGAWRARLAEGWQALTARDLPKAHAIADEILRDAQSTEARGRARELDVWAFLVENKLDQAESSLRRMPPGHHPDLRLEGNLYLQLGKYEYAATLLRDALAAQPDDHTASRLAHALVYYKKTDEALALADHPACGPYTLDVLMAAAFYAQRYAEALRLGERWFAAKPHPRCAFNLACTLARMERLDEAGGWLARAVDAGWKDLKTFDEDPDLAPLRGRADYLAARARLTSLGRT
jgi:tetratricopeptide (TPR) repeat protein